MIVSWSRLNEVSNIASIKIIAAVVNQLGLFINNVV